MAYYSHTVYSQPTIPSINTGAGLFSLGSFGSLFNTTNTEPVKPINTTKKMGNSSSVTPVEQPPNAAETGEEHVREETEKTTPDIVIDDAHNAPADGLGQESEENELGDTTSENESKTSVRELDEEKAEEDTTDTRKNRKEADDTQHETFKKQRSRSYSEVDDLEKSAKNDALSTAQSTIHNTQSTTALDWLLNGFRKEPSTGSTSSLDKEDTAAKAPAPKSLWPFFAPAPPPPPSEEEKEELERLEAAIGDMDVPWGLNRGGEDAWTAEMKQQGGIKHPRHDKIIGYHSLPPPFSPKQFTSPTSDTIGSPREMGGGNEGMALGYR